MTSICMYFQVHQPPRLGKYSFFDIGSGKSYFSYSRNKEIFDRVARKCYFPANALLKKLIDKYAGWFRVSFSLTGTFIEQCLEYNSKVLESFRELFDTGCVDILDETYYHSLAFLISEEEFKEQVRMHRNLIREHFGYIPVVFRNTEAMYSNDVANTVASMGYKGILAEGWHSYLGWRSPDYVYKSKGTDLRLLLRNYRLSDDISFRFSTPSWSEFPLTADKYASWLSACRGDVINLFMDYETFGEHQWESTGIFNFLEHLPHEVSKHRHLDFATTREVVERFKPMDEIDVPYFSSWADVHRDLSAWLENDMQNEAFKHVKELEHKVKATGDKELIHTWRKLTTSDHFYYMCTKWFADGDIHKYFNSYENPYDAFTNYMNILSDFKERVLQRLAVQEDVIARPFSARRK